MDIARYLDWDAPLSEQSDSVKLALGLIRDKKADDAVRAQIKVLDDEILKAQGGSEGETLEEMFDRVFSYTSEENAYLGNLERQRTALKEQLEAPSGRYDYVKQAQIMAFSRKTQQAKNYIKVFHI